MVAAEVEVIKLEDEVDEAVEASVPQTPAKRRPPGHSVPVGGCDLQFRLCSTTVLLKADTVLPLIQKSFPLSYADVRNRESLHAIVSGTFPSGPHSGGARTFTGLNGNLKPKDLKATVAHLNSQHNLIQHSILKDSKIFKLFREITAKLCPALTKFHLARA